MSGKAVITILAALSFAMSACTPVHEAPAPPKDTASALKTLVIPAKHTMPTSRRANTTPRQTRTPTSPRQVSSPISNATIPHDSPYADLPPLLHGNASWNTYGRDLVVTHRVVSQPVPIFRQAIVLAAVRAELAKSPIEPKAEFLKGILTLTFDRGTSAEVAADINRTLDIPEVAALNALLGVQ